VISGVLNLNFESLSEFFAMGGHATYVWLSYGMGFCIFILAFLQPYMSRKSILRELSQLHRRGKSKPTTTSKVIPQAD